MSTCPHRVERRFCGLCGGLNDRHPGQVGAETRDGYRMESGDWQTALWHHDEDEREQVQR